MNYGAVSGVAETASLVLTVLTLSDVRGRLENPRAWEGAAFGLGLVALVLSLRHTRATY